MNPEIKISKIIKITKKMNLAIFLKEYRLIKNENKQYSLPVTHTSYGGMGSGSYHIPMDKINMFYELYNIELRKGSIINLIERHDEVSPIVIDLDFKFSDEHSSRQFSDQIVKNIVSVYIDAIKEIWTLEDSKLNAFVFTRDEPYFANSGDKTILKDGLHIMFPEIVSKPDVQYYLREKVLLKMPTILKDLPLTNNIDDIVDIAVIEKNGWFMYGSSKPDMLPYKLVNIYDESLNIIKNDFDIDDMAKMLSIRNKTNISAVKHEIASDLLYESKTAKCLEKQIYKNDVQVDKIIDTTNKYIDLLFKLGSNKNYKRTDWLIICGWCNSHATKDIFLKFVDDSWQKQALDMWNNIICKPIPIHWIETFAKRISPEIYKVWLKQWNIYFIMTNDLEDPFATAKIISKTLSSSLVLCNEKWYMLTEQQLWKQQKEPSFYIINELRKYIDESNKKIVYKISQCSGEEKDKLVEQSKLYLASYKNISQSGFLNVLTKYLKTLLTDNSFELKLDNNAGYLAFQNGIVNLETKEFRSGIQADDFITKTILYDYGKADINKIQYVKDVLLKILNNNSEHLEYFLSLIGFTFIGNPHLQKSIYFCVDKTTKSAGDNGKTFFFDILEHLCPNYVYKTNKSFFEDGNKKLHKQLAMMKGSRLVYADEFNEKKVNAEFMKVIGDGLKIENEIMFGTSETINIMFKAWILTNHIPNIDAKEQAVYNRYNQISYGSHFDRTGNRLIENSEKLEFIADCELGDKIKTLYSNEIFELIIDYANKYYNHKLPAIPKQFKSDAEATKMKNDEYGSWFLDHCIEDANERVALKAIVISSGIHEKLVKEGMIRLGYKYNKDLSKLGKDEYGKTYKGGYVGCKLIPEENDEDDDADVECSEL